MVTGGSVPSRQDAAGLPDRRQQMYVLNVYMFIGFLALFVFGLLHILVEHNTLVGQLEIGGAGAIGITALGLWGSHNIGLARISFLLTLLTMMVVMLITGGTQGTGIFWLYVFPVAAFFLAGRRAGTYWVAFLFVIVGLLWATSLTDYVVLYYNTTTVRQLLVSLAVVAIGMWVYERSREQSLASASQSSRRLQANVQEMTTLHGKVDHAKSEFVTLASHQLRTPISAIGWSTEMLLNGDMGVLKGPQRDSIQGIYDSNKRLGAIVDAMLMVSSLELGQVDVRLQRINVVTLCHKLFRDELKKFRNKTFTIHEHYVDKLPELRVDPGLLSRILENLFSNACKYTPSGGAITVSIVRSQDKLTPRSKGSVQIIVADNGYGIPTDDQENVFAKLFRAANIKTKDTDGTGLGLYVVKALLDKVGGRVSFTSTENEGSRFIVHLPLEGMIPTRPKPTTSDSMSMSAAAHNVTKGNMIE